MPLLTDYLSIDSDLVSDVSMALLKGRITLFLSFFLSFAFALYVLPRILLIAKKKHLFDNPNQRKSHTEAVPRLGGIVFLPSIVFSLSLTTAFRFLIGFPLNPIWSDGLVMESLLMLAGITLLYLVGAKDDLIGVRYRMKFLAEFLTASLLPLSGLYINNFYGLLGMYEIPFWFAVPFTVVVIVFITNAINLIDGIDGLAVGLTSIAFGVLGVLFFEREMYTYAFVSFSILGCLLPFTYYNVLGGSRKYKMFMGDTGSLILGFSLSYLCIKYMMLVPDYIPFDIRSVLIPITLLFIPGFDAIRVMVVRAFRRRSLFIADRNHIHHLCLDTGMTHVQATTFLLCFSLSLLLLNWSLVNYLNINLLLLVDIFLFLGLVRVLIRLKRKEKE